MNLNFESGRCKRVRLYLDSYLSNELMVETNHEVLTHLEACEACSRMLEDRARLKAQLKRAVMQEYAPAALRERIGADLRRNRGFSFNRISLSLAAAAAVLAIAVATFFISRPANKSLSLEAAVGAGDAAGRVLKIGFDDHVFCTIDHQLADRQFTPEQMSERLGPEYSGLIGLVKEKMPQPYTIAVGHRCHYQGREFIHLVLRSQDEIVSLVITRKSGEGFPADGSAAVLRASGVSIYERSWHNIQVAGLETPDHLAFVISNKSREGNEQVALSLAPAVDDFLRRLETRV
ncbi:MAG TPA: zf-HC2 domain-containing protein [Blastocatellia bacterium]|nr:zf-HC2 domain-containing protein [Blastocatellia bacterium]